MFTSVVGGRTYLHCLIFDNNFDAALTFGILSHGCDVKTSVFNATHLVLEFDVCLRYEYLSCVLIFKPSSTQNSWWVYCFDQTSSYCLEYFRLDRFGFLSYWCFRFGPDCFANSSSLFKCILVIDFFEYLIYFINCCWYHELCLSWMSSMIMRLNDMDFTDDTWIESFTFYCSLKGVNRNQ